VSISGVHAQPEAPLRLWPVITTFAVVVALQLAVAIWSIDVLSSVRAYVEGEGYYSKGQKDGPLQLIRYLDTRRDEDYQRFLAGMRAATAYREAREALQMPTPDMQAVERAYLRGGTDPADVDGAIRLFVYFGGVRQVKDAIAI
jgi:hypothetical protein